MTKIFIKKPTLGLSIFFALFVGVLSGPDFVFAECDPELETDCGYGVCVSLGDECPTFLCPDGVTTSSDPFGSDCPEGTVCPDGSTVYPPEECEPPGFAFYCPRPDANDAQADCVFGNPGKVCIPDDAECNQIACCSQNNAAECEACPADSVCNPTSENPPCNCGCADPKAANYDPEVTCSDAPSSCIYKTAWCGWIVEFTFEYNGKFYHVIASVAYWYDPETEGCAEPDIEELEGLAAAYIDSGTPSSNPNDPSISFTEITEEDWCPNIKGIQDEEFFNDGGYHHDSNGDCVACDEATEFWCVNTLTCMTLGQEGVCQGAETGVCGPAAKTYAPEESFPDGDYCSVGSASPASPTDPGQSGSSAWSCEGINGGAPASCNASITCTFPTTWCGPGVGCQESCGDMNGICGSTLNSCGLGVTATNPRPAESGTNLWTCAGTGTGKPVECHDNIIHGSGEAVDLDTLTVRPRVIEFNNSCTVDWTDSFNSYWIPAQEEDPVTTCVLSNQDNPNLKTFNPDTDEDGEYTQLLVKKDTIYTLTCTDSDNTLNPVSETGFCRINVKQGEFN